MNKNIININQSIDMKEKHNNNEKWHLFARRITKNEFMKKYLRIKYDNICPWCGYPLNDNFVIHHIDYDHECFTGDIITIPHPTPKRPNKVNKVPNCESCKNNNKDKFKECIKKIVPIHKYCNYEIEKINKGINL